MISLRMLQEEPDVLQYSGPPIAIAVLLEGVFLSDFRNRLPQEILTNKEIGFKEKSVKNKHDSCY